MSGSDGPTAPARALPRHEARTRALQLLFAADVRGRPLGTAAEGAGEGADRLDAFTLTLIDTVVANAADIDRVIGDRARGWTLQRMPVVDRNVLRLGLAELLFLDEVPAAVAIDEAVELAKTLSTDDSPRFVNGILSAVARERGLVG